MAKKPALQLDDLEKSLEPLTPEPGSRLEKVQALFDEVASLMPDVDLETLSDADLLKDDSAARTRRVYALSLLRLYKFLRNNFDVTLTTNKETGEKFLAQVPDTKAQIEQSKVALGYIRHAETMRLEALQLGRTPKDAEYGRLIAQVRADLDEITRIRAQFKAEEPPAKVWEKTDAVSKTEV